MSGSRGWRRRRRAIGSRTPIAAVIAAFAVGIALGVGIFWGPGHIAAAHSAPARARHAPSGTVVSTHTFKICDTERRYTCVVDGDTFWLEGVKIRIADFDAPEVSEPRCKSEFRLGTRATRRLVELLNQGPFKLARASDGRNEDRYGRKLRIVQRNGRSIGDTLVAEGLAHPWRGRREPWC